MPSPAYAIFRNAILNEHQVSCSYEGRYRELCPHIIGTNKAGEEVVLAWQFAGSSSGPLPQWRCLRIANVRNARARVGPWHEGKSHRTKQTCVTTIDLDQRACAQTALAEIARNQGYAASAARKSRRGNTASRVLRCHSPRMRGSSIQWPLD
jgi:hypothetical protein